MVPAQATPHRKLVVFPPVGGVYEAMYGPILNPVEGDYSTGSADPESSRPLRGNPEPKHCRWRYWESELDKGDWLVPRFHCLQVSGEWWVVEMDRGRGLFQQVAGLEFADNPEHNSGIHAQKDTVYLRPANDESEFSKVLRENLPGVAMTWKTAARLSVMFLTFLGVLVVALPYLFPQDVSLFEGRGEVMALVAAALLVMAVAMKSEEGNLPVLVGLVSGVFMIVSTAHILADKNPFLWMVVILLAMVFFLLAVALCAPVSMAATLPQAIRRR